MFIFTDMKKMEKINIYIETKTAFEFFYTKKFAFFNKKNSVLHCEMFILADIK